MQSSEVFMQKVYLSQTQSGIYGYFTGGFLVWNLTPDEYAKPADWHISNCSRRGWMYVSR